MPVSTYFNGAFNTELKYKVKYTWYGNLRFQFKLRSAVKKWRRRVESVI